MRARIVLAVVTVAQAVLNAAEWCTGSAFHVARGLRRGFERGLASRAGLALQWRADTDAGLVIYRADVRDLHFVMRCEPPSNAWFFTVERQGDTVFLSADYPSEADAALGAERWLKGGVGPTATSPRAGGVDTKTPLDAAAGNPPSPSTPPAPFGDTPITEAEQAAQGERGYGPWPADDPRAQAYNYPPYTSSSGGLT